MKITLTCPADALTSLQRQVDAVRKSSSTVRCDRAALAALLIDHTRLLVAVRRTDIRTEEAPEPAPRDAADREDLWKPVAPRWPDEMREPWDQPAASE